MSRLVGVFVIYIIKTHRSISKLSDYYYAIRVSRGVLIKKKLRSQNKNKKKKKKKKKKFTKITKKKQLIQQYKN